MINDTDIVIRPARKEDIEAVSDLLRALGLSLPPKEDAGKVAAHWDRLWHNNPYYHEFKEDVFYGWVMVHLGRIVGFFGSIPRVYYLQGIKIPVSVGSNWGVEKEYRKYTHMLCNAYFNHNPIDLKLATTAIKPSGKIFEQYGGKRMPDANIDSVYMIPFHLGKLLALKLNKVPASGIIATVAGALWKLKFITVKKDNALVKTDPGNIPDEFEAFQARYTESIKGLIASHNRDTMKWVYAYGNEKTPKTLFVYYGGKNSEITGYAALMEAPVSNESNIKRYKIVDVLASSPAEKRKILKALISHCYLSGADVLEVHLPCTIRREDIPATTLHRKTPAFPVLFHTTNAEYANLLSRKENWNITPYDGDTSLG